MKLSTRGRYAVMAMTDLASRPERHPISVGEIAERQNISPTYLEQIFGRLRKSGLLTSVRGPGGGFSLAHEPGDIRISDIILAVDEPMKVTRCDAGTPRGCLKTGRCLTHDLWAELGQHLYLFLSSVSLDDVIGKRVLGLAGQLHVAHRDRSEELRAAGE
jgi:Rrf2 family iron-sulfur cluster assembly transcriptional regulator